MQGQFRHLHFKTFPMTPRTPQCKVFLPFNSSSKFLGVLEDSKFPLLGVWASPSHLAQSWVTTFSFLAFASTLLFQKFFPGIFFFSRKKKQKNHREEKKCRKRREFSFKLPLCLFNFDFYFCPRTSTLLFQTIFLGIFFFSSKRKINHRKGKKCKEGRELSFKLPLCIFTFGSHFLPPVFAHFFQALSPWHFLLLKQKKKKKNTKKKKP